MLAVALVEAAEEGASDVGDSDQHAVKRLAVATIVLIRLIPLITPPITRPRHNSSSLEPSSKWHTTASHSHQDYSKE
ncbi:Hypothetical protein FKW44_012723 [Caligus rogercresseyi]|uniref:Uncharacterized protein n=1 Tax=Caligus rogercresseyi TaxID=217165 RepID=A0A7T8HK61_CALRO|nr:Hypothetical protein FKW44_012723 [Caligus rogercresseyi]